MKLFRAIMSNKSNTNVISLIKPIILTSSTRPMFCLPSLLLLLLLLAHGRLLARCQSSHFRPIQQPSNPMVHNNYHHQQRQHHHQNQGYHSQNQHNLYQRQAVHHSSSSSNNNHYHHTPSNLSSQFGLPPLQQAQTNRRHQSGAAAAPRSPWQSRNNFIAKINERVRLERLAKQQNQQQQQQRDFNNRGHHRQQAHEHRQTKSINYPDNKGALISDRRASASSWSPNQLMSQQDHSKSGAFQQHKQQEPQQKQQQAADGQKLLICYYTTRQTAPYWPKDAREFIIPADQLSNQMMQQHATGAPTASAAAAADQFRSASSVNVGSFNDRYPNYQHNQLQVDPHQHEKYTRTNNNGQQSGASAMTASDGSVQQQQQHFADGRQMIVVSPKFAPFNQSASAIGGADQLAAPPVPSMAFFPISPSLANSRQHPSIASRQDSATAGETISAAPPPSPRQQLIVTGSSSTSAAMTMTTTSAAAGGRLQSSSGSENNSNFAANQRQRDDNNGLVGGQLQDYARLAWRQQQQQQQPYGVSSSSLAPISVQAPAIDLTENGAKLAGGGPDNGNGATMIYQQQQQHQFARQQSPLISAKINSNNQNNNNNNRGYSGMLVLNSNNFNNNGESLNNQQQQQLQHLRQQLIISPSPSRSLVAATAAAANSGSGGGLSTTIMPSMNNNEPQPIFAQQLPGGNGNNNNNPSDNNYYYFYNNQATSSSSSQSSSLPINFATAASTVTPINELALATATTMALGSTGSGQQNNNQQQQQQQQQAKSLHAAESKLSPAHQLGSQLAAGGASFSASSLAAPVAVAGGKLATGEAGDGLDRNTNIMPSVASSSSPSSSSYQLNGATHGTIDQQLSLSPLSTTSTRSFSPFPSSSVPPGGDIIKFPSSSSSSPTDDGKTTPSLSSSGLLAPLVAATTRPSGASGSHIVTSDELLARQQQQQQTSSLSSALVSSPLSTMFDVFGAASQYLMRFKPSSLISPSSFAFNSNSNNNNLASGADHNSAAPGHLHPSKHQHQHQSKHSSNLLKSPNSTSLFSGSAASFISFPFSDSFLSAAAGGGSGSDVLHQKSSLPLLGNERSGGGSSTSGAANMSSTGSISSTFGSAGGLLSRLTLQNNQPQQQRREDMCGRTIQTPERRIIGGEGARYGEFPYQVHIKIAKHQCGGALVDRQSIVTAAHCVYHFITRAPVSKLQIVIGAYDIEDEQYQELPPQYFKVNKVKLHPNFRFSASHPDRYDIAILKLDKPVKYTDNVLPVCLPGKDLKFENTVGTVTGFGKTDPSLSNRYGTRLLQKVDVPIIENNECERWHRTRGIDLKIFPEMMCAGYEDGLKDACVGDSGGPLVVKTPVGNNGSFRWTLAGITSAGFGCAQSRQPGIYHRVSHTVDWILENLD